VTTASLVPMVLERVNNGERAMDLYETGMKAHDFSRGMKRRTL